MCYRIVRLILLAILIASGLVACTGSEESGARQASWYSRHTLYSYTGKQGNLWDRLRQHLTIPTYAYRAEVQHQIRFYQHNPDYFNHVIQESAPYIYYIYQQTQKRHLPADLALIPIIESEYNPYSRSKVGATGLWQMMPDTAKGFGLKHSWWYDGRKDVVTSTRAALEYFTYLHAFFNNNWLLAIGAYDCGEGRVTNDIRYSRMHGRPTDFWHLPVPEETRYYVPRLLAVAAIIKDPARYHIKLIPINDAPFVEQVNIDKQVNLKNVAKMAEVPLNTIRELNPGIQHESTDPKGPYALLVPSEKADTFKMKLALLEQSERLAWQKHIVQSRETLAKIADQYKINVAMLREVNGLKTNTVQPNQTLLIPPATSAPSEPSTIIANNDLNVKNTPVTKDNTNTTANAELAPEKIIYQAKTGNTLAFVATKYNVSVKQLREWNNLSLHHHLKPGEKLVIMPKESTTELAANDNSAAVTNDTQSLTATYKVTATDSIHTIAHRFHTTPIKIRNVNHLASNSVKTGQVLIIPNSNAPTQLATVDTNKIVYTVHRGDFVAKIAKHFKVTEEEINQWNSLSSEQILQPGQKLVILHASA